MGVLRSGAENITWTATGEAPGWAAARRCAIAALHELAHRERRRQEYRMQVGDVPVIVWPGLDRLNRLDLSGVDAVLPRDRDAPSSIW